MADSKELRPRDDGNDRSGGFLSELFAPVAGFGVSFANMFKRVETEQYPEEKTPTQPRYHGRHQLNRHPDGLEKCIGCELCAWACPADAIYVEGADNTDEARFSPGERYGRVYQINYLRCIFCGLCIEACPTRALTMTNEYEMAGPSRAGLIYEKTDLLAPMQPGMLEAPHPVVPGTDEQSYYRGEVTGAVDEQRDWVRAHRPEREPEHAGTPAGSTPGWQRPSPRAEGTAPVGTGSPAMPPGMTQLSGEKDR